jgi:hypothetical protein
MGKTRLRRVGKLRQWFFEGMKEHTLREPSARTADESSGHKTHAWWQVMCLTGVDYFSTLGYQPGIAFVATAELSPIATIVLVLVTLFGALPMYHRVARISPHGQGSISMLESLFPRWKGKAVVLSLLGFAATGFVITITLSAADAAEHIIENPMMPAFFHGHEIFITIVLLVVLGAILLKGFKEAIGVAVILVAVYLVLNVVVVGYGLLTIWNRPDIVLHWETAIASGETHGDPLLIALVALLVFPKLALGLSGFETGVAVMPLVQGDPTDTNERPEGRIRNTKKLLTTAAVIMSFLLIGSSVVTTLLIPVLSPEGREAFAEGGEAYGRALSFLAHTLLGHGFGTLYDFSTIAILWFAGSSAFTGLLTLVPRYLPRYGMAPGWARATRPLVLVITLLSLVVTLLFKADVESQAGAYATGVLGLMTSGAIAVAVAMWRGGWRRWFYLAIAVVFVYAMVSNIVQRPEGIKIASFFVGAIVGTSLVSRAYRSTELRVSRVVLDEEAQRFVREASQTGVIRIVTNRPDKGTTDEYDAKEKEAREAHHIPRDDKILLLEVRISDASQFADVLQVRGKAMGRHKVLRCDSPAVPNAIAAFLLHTRDVAGRIPHVYFGWTEGNPIVYVLKFIFLGEGDTAPMTREILRKRISEPERRPRVHVG